jgi:hypothetical protein
MRFLFDDGNSYNSNWDNASSSMLMILNKKQEELSGKEHQWVKTLNLNTHYEINNTTNQSRVVPRGKLKVINKVQNDDDEIEEILNINNQRTRNNILEYLATGKSDRSKELVNVNDFHSKIMINGYHSSKPLRKRGKPSIKSLNYVDLQLADADYKEFINNKLFNKIMAHIYSNQNKLNLYSDCKHVIIPTSVTLKKIVMLNKTNKCYKDVPVESELNHKIKHCFLTDELIVISKSKQIDCKSNERKIIINNSRILLVDKEYTTTMENKFKKLRLNFKIKNLNQLNFHHSEKVVDSFSVVEDLVKYARFIEDSVLVYETESLNKQKLSNEQRHQENNLMYQILAPGSVIGSILITIAVIILIIVFKQPSVSALKYVHEIAILPCINKKHSVKLNYSKTSNKSTKNNTEVNIAINEQIYDINQ